MVSGWHDEDDEDGLLVDRRGRWRAVSSKSSPDNSSIAASYRAISSGPYSNVPASSSSFLLIFSPMALRMFARMTSLRGNASHKLDNLSWILPAVSVILEA